MFSDAVIQKIGSYVYFLRDPRNQEVFYIGKGEGNRVFSHAAGVPANDGDPQQDSEKLARISDIKREAKQVEHFILRHGLTNEEAFELESALIDFVGLKNLSNQQGGHYASDFGLKTTGEIIAMYDAKPFSTDKKVLLININRQFSRTMTAEEIYEATRSCWRLGENRNQAEYAIATYAGLTREVYAIKSWYQVNDRWAFTGKLADSSIRESLSGKSITHLAVKGAANPIRYVNIK